VPHGLFGGKRMNVSDATRSRVSVGPILSKDDCGVGNNKRCKHVPSRMPWRAVDSRSEPLYLFSQRDGNGVSINSSHSGLRSYGNHDESLATIAMLVEPAS
jgi:hypothetical protein